MQPLAEKNTQGTRGSPAHPRETGFVNGYGRRSNVLRLITYRAILSSLSANEHTQSRLTRDAKRQNLDKKTSSCIQTKIRTRKKTRIRAKSSMTTLTAGTILAFTGSAARGAGGRVLALYKRSPRVYKLHRFRLSTHRRVIPASTREVQ